jgi:hypothetical protein
MIFCSRATRGLRRMGRERPGALLARRTRTVKLCSFDARSKGQPWPLSSREVMRIGRPSPGLMTRPRRRLRVRREYRLIGAGVCLAVLRGELWRDCICLGHRRCALPDSDQIVCGVMVALVISSLLRLATACRTLVLWCRSTWQPTR